MIRVGLCQASRSLPVGQPWTSTWRTWLSGHPDGTGPVAVLGFCLGGDFALLLAPSGSYRDIVSGGTRDGGASIGRHRVRALPNHVEKTLDRRLDGLVAASGLSRQRPESSRPDHSPATGPGCTPDRPHVRPTHTEVGRGLLRRFLTVQLRRSDAVVDGRGRPWTSTA